MATLDPERAKQLHRYWCAANYLTVGQIYLRENPLLREPLRPEHIKPRLLGHWGTSPGLSFIYAHLNRLITDTDANVIYLAGPGHGGPAIVANVYLEGTYSEIYPAGLDGRRRPAAAVPPVLHAGRHPEPRQRAHARVDPRGRRARLRAGPRVRRGVRQPRPDRGRGRRRRRGGDRSARGGVEEHQVPQSGARRRGAADPAPQRLQDLGAHRARARRRRRRAQAARGARLRRHFVEGRAPTPRPRADATASTTTRCRCTWRSRRRSTARTSGSARSRTAARARGGAGARPRWPAIVLRTPKGWTGPRVVDGMPVEGTFRAHQVPLANVRQQPRALADARTLDAQLPAGRAVRSTTAASCRSSPRWPRAATAAWARTRTPTAAGSPSISSCPTFASTASRCRSPRRERHESTRRLGQWMRDIFKNNEERASVCSAPTRPTPIASATSSPSRTAARPARSCPATITWRPTAA